jgi:hypothetical protein
MTSELTLAAVTTSLDDLVEDNIAGYEVRFDHLISQLRFAGVEKALIDEIRSTVAEWLSNAVFATQTRAGDPTLLR